MMNRMLLAAITNPALPAGLQDASTPQAAGAGLARYIGILWQTSLVMGGLGVVVYMLIGGVTWIMADGEKGKVEQAKERIKQALIGLVVLFSIAAISVFFGTALGIDLLVPDFGALTGVSGNGGLGNGGGGNSNTQNNPFCIGKAPTGNCNDCGFDNQGMCGYGISDTCNCNLNNAPCDSPYRPNGRGGCSV